MDKTCDRIKRLWNAWTYCLALCATTPAAHAMAAENGGWRPVYDNVMLVVNFFVLVFILVKLTKSPLSNFLKEKRNQISSELDRLLKERDHSRLELEETRAQTERIESRIKDIKSRIIEEGERAKEAMIESARSESSFLIEAAKRRVNARFARARDRLREELVDAALEIVEKRLPDMLDRKDHQNQVNIFVESLEKARATF